MDRRIGDHVRERTLYHCGGRARSEATGAGTAEVLLAPTDEERKLQQLKLRGGHNHSELKQSG